MTNLSGVLFQRATPEGEVSWIDYLKSKIQTDWRPDEFDYEHLLYVPDLDSSSNTIAVCPRQGCTIRLNRSGVCAGCRSDHKRKDPETPLREWIVTAPPPDRFQPSRGCGVAKCQRTHNAHGLCDSHAANLRNWRNRTDGDDSIERWIAENSPRPLGPLPMCPARICAADRGSSSGLCAVHDAAFKRWMRGGGISGRPVTVDIWMQTQIEPPMDPDTLASYREVSATPFGLIPEPLRWEYLFAVQKRDLSGRSKLAAQDLRHTYLHHRRTGQTTVVGETSLARLPATREQRAILAELQRHVDEAHRAWTGIDERDRKIIHFADLEVRQHNRSIGPNAVIDLRSIQQDWIVDAVRVWAFGSARGYDELGRTGNVWKIAAEVLDSRGTPVHSLGAQDMDAVVTSVREKWPDINTQRRCIRQLKLVVENARFHEDTEVFWRQIPARFAVDSDRHRVRAVQGHAGPSSNDDEPFRFVPQPIIDHLMDHLHLLTRRSDYLTAEARVMLFVHERCGRRTGETIRLSNDCLSYDNQGAPYLEWRRGKPPYSMGKRLPIHQETHDVIRQWQEIKLKHGIESKWLFPSTRYVSVDKHWSNPYLNARVAEFIETVCELAPFVGTVEGAEGNLIHFDMRSIDPYAFRHAFAQRYADATDADGRSTTPPDVLQEYMGHASFNTTMTYFEVTTKRRKKALEAIAPRRLNLIGDVISVDRERDGFTKVAVTSGHCTEPQNVAAHGEGCMVNHACESCPFFLVDPLERDSMGAKRQALRVKYERAKAINAQQHVLDHYEARIKDCTSIVDGIDAYVDSLSVGERDGIRHALERMADVRQRATAVRIIDLRELLRGPADP